MTLSDDTLCGLTCRFKVTVDHNDLGGWDSCKGLQINFNLIEVREGGTNDHSYWLPDKIKYDKITLTRAMTKATSKVIQDWLKSYIDHAQKSKAGPPPRAIRAATLVAEGAFDRVHILVSARCWLELAGPRGNRNRGRSRLCRCRSAGP